LREPRGIVITRVSDGSPAARAGLKAGDVILRFDGEQVMTYRKLQRLISEAAPEQNVRLSISRNGAEQEISVTLGRRDDALQSLSRVYGAQSAIAPRILEQTQRSMEQLRNNPGLIGFGGGRRIGINTTQLTRQLADYFGVQGGRGLLVTSVAENSPAARAGLKAGDVITDVDGEPVESAGDISRAINRKNEGAVNLKIVRDRSTLTLSVTPEKRESGAISISPELFEIETGDMEIALPTIDIRLPQIKQITPIKIQPIKIPKLKITPRQLEQLKKLESIELESLMTL
jgi:serine protease Do